MTPYQHLKDDILLCMESYWLLKYESCRSVGVKKAKSLFLAQHEQIAHDISVEAKEIFEEHTTMRG